MEIIENSSINYNYEDDSNKKQREQSKEEDSKKKKYSGIQKAAILVIALGDEASSEIFKHLDVDESQRLLQEVIRLKQVSKKEIAPVVKELEEILKKDEQYRAGGTAYASFLIDKSLGKTKAKDAYSHLKQQMNKKPFELLEKMEEDNIADLINDEHPQTIATILYHLKAKKASRVLKQLPKEIISDVARRIAKIKKVDPQILANIEEGLNAKFEKMKDSLSTIKTDGLERISEILQYADVKTNKNIMEKLNDDSPDLAGEIQKKIFTYDDILNLNDKDVHKLLSHVQDFTLIRAIKGSSDDIKAKIYANMSSNRIKAIEEGIEAIGIIPSNEIHTAQQQIVNLIRRLDEKGVISIIRKADDFLIR